MPLKFDSTRVAVVDRNAECVLVRGMDPAVSGSFDYEALGLALVKRGVDIATMRLVVINVIDNVGERWAWTPEMKAFGVDSDSIPISQWPPYLNRPSWDPTETIGDGQWVAGSQSGSGDMYWWPFEGIPAGEDPKVFLTAPGWDFAGVVEQITRLFQTERNAMVYFHCMLGADRTGALHTGYLMKSKGLALGEASKIADASTSAHGPNADYQRLREAYAEFLRK